MDQFTYDESDFIFTSDTWQSETSQTSKFDRKLRDGWDRAMDNGHFRYQLDIEEVKVIGDKSYLAQLNIKRAQERRKPDAINTVNQPFNPASFNFTKIKDGEVLFEMVKTSDSLANGYAEDDSKMQKRNLVIINVSPLEYGHVLLVPDPNACRPQILTEEALQLSLECMLLSKHRGFRVGFNSLCAYASVNHLHLHAYYLETEMFLESAPVDFLCDNLYELACMPVKGFAFQLHGCDVWKLSQILFSIADYFQKNEIAHNLYMTRGSVFGEDRASPNRTVRVYLWARKKFIGTWMKDEAAFNVALVELAGHLPIKVKELFDDLDQKKVEDTMAAVALDPEEYARVKQDVTEIVKQTNTI